MVWNNVNRVLVLIPPPVEPGDAPINIRMDTVSRPADVKSPSGNVLNPAVLADTLVKNAPSQVMSSVSRISSVPAARSISVVTITALEWRHSFLKERFLKISMITRKPSPPKIMSPAVVRFRSTSSLYPVRFLRPPRISKPELLNAATEWNRLIPSALTGG